MPQERKIVKWGNAITLSIFNVVSWGYMNGIRGFIERYMVALCLEVPSRGPRRIFFTRSLHFISSLFVLLFASLSSASMTYAEALNARVTGELTKLSGIVNQTSDRCNAPYCEIATGPIRLSVTASSRIRYQVALTSMKVPTALIRTRGQAIEEDFNSRPLLFRGTAYVRHNMSSMALPVAATLYRDNKIPVLEISAPRPARKNSKGSNGIFVVRSSMSSLMNNSGKNARAQVTSSFAFSRRGCSVTSNNHISAQSQANRKGASVSAQATYNVVYVATDYDPQFASKAQCSSSSSCKNKILSIVNQAAVFYERQLGYTLEVARQFGPTNYGTATSSSTVLDDFQQRNAASRLQYVHTGTNSTDNQADVFQLFTGRSMDDDVIGVAYVGVTCRNDQSDFADAVVERVSDTLDPVTTAHELGHTLNAEHTSSGIMKPNLGASPPQSFSSTSLTTISSFLGTWYSQCRQGTSNGTDAATPTPTPASSGGANGGPSPFENKPVTLQLQAQRPGRKTLRLTSTVTSLVANCSVKIRAAATSASSFTGTIVAEFTPNELTKVLSAKVSSGVKPSKSTGSNIFFAAEHSCVDGTILEVSQVTKFNPNKVKGIAKTVSKGRWIKALQKSLQ